MRTVIGIGLLLLTLTGCSSDAVPAPAPSASAAAPAPSPPPSFGPSPSPSPSPTTPAAADGTNVRACRDGTCEILVTRRTGIPVPARFRVRGLSVTPGDGEVDVRADAGMMQAGGRTGALLGLNGLEIEVVAAGDGEAVLRLRPA